MKELIIAILLVLILPVGALINSYLLSERCDALIDVLTQDDMGKDYAQRVSDEWQALRRFAAYTTPYDLVRSANNACEGYLARLGEDSSDIETEASLVQFRSAVDDLRRIHAFSLELIF